MAEKIISPGVFTNEIDQSFLPSAVADIGAALVGPTLKGPAGIPTVVTSFSDFQAKFGDVFKSGSNSFQFLTSHAAEEYLKNSDTLTVVRVMDGTFGPASADVSSDGDTTVGTNIATGSMQIQTAALGERYKVTEGSNSFTFIASADGGGDSSDDTVRFFEGSTTLSTHVTNLVSEINAVDGLSVTAVSQSNQLLGFTASSAGTGNNGITFVTSSTATPGTFASAPAVGGATTTGFILSGGTDTAGTSVVSFTLETLADGTIMNNADSTTTTNSILTSGSKHNIRYEVVGKNNAKGTFNLLIRAGNDNQKRKQTLETFNNVSLDPNSINFIQKVVGDQKQTVRTDGTTKYLQLTGSYPNASRYVRVSSVTSPTVDYLDENGSIRLNSLSASLPANGSGSNNGGFSGATDGTVGFDALGNQNGTIETTAVNFYDSIGSQTQGFSLGAGAEATSGSNGYTEALDLLANQDEFDINLILLPGVIDSLHTSVTTKAIDVCESRGDCFAILDPVPYGSTLASATARGDARDSNFAAMYWPWVKVPDTQVAGTQRWVPPSVTLGGIYAFNDRVAHPWFAPAGLNRGGITTAIQAERKLTQGNRDDLYDSNINPIATFPGQGVTVFGQKTLQKKSSALDRVNVRRLLIRVKKFVASSSRFLVFEQNTAATRRRFLGIVNPFLEQVQAQSGLSAFRVVMDETNNTPDTIDRNQLIGQLFLQPTRTAEFIVLDFTIQPTGASFPE
jgi:phage tail sheath protein FI